MKQNSQSKKVYTEMCNVIPGGVNSPVRSFSGLGLSPLIVASGQGDLIKDVDGNEYIDYCGSWGALIHGHAHPKILEAAQKSMERGTTFGISTEVEGELAKKIVEMVPDIEKVRCVSSGTEATMSAIRLARGFTGRDLVIKFSGNYHGHADFFLVQAGSGVLGLSQSSSAGIPPELVQHTLSLTYNDSNILLDAHIQKKLAAVIVEPIAGNMGVVPARPYFLRALRKMTSDVGALLIFDEVITGFRLGRGGAQEYFDIKPDLTCLGKIMGGGFPAAAFGGRAEIMDHLAPLGKVYQAGTLSGNPVAMTAGLQALQLLERENFYAELEEKANLITQPLKEKIKNKGLNACVQQVGSMFTLFFGQTKVENLDDAKKLDLQKFAEFFRYLLERGVYIPPSQHEAWFVSAAHTERHLEKTRDLILDFL